MKHNPIGPILHQDFQIDTSMACVFGNFLLVHTTIKADCSHLSNHEKILLVSMEEENAHVPTGKLFRNAPIPKYRKKKNTCFIRLEISHL